VVTQATTFVTLGYFVASTKLVSIICRARIMILRAALQFQLGSHCLGTDATQHGFTWTDYCGLARMDELDPCLELSGCDSSDSGREICLKTNSKRIVADLREPVLAGPFTRSGSKLNTKINFGRVDLAIPSFELYGASFVSACKSSAAFNSRLKLGRLCLPRGRLHFLEWLAIY